MILTCAYTKYTKNDNLHLQCSLNHPFLLVTLAVLLQGST